MGIYDIDGNRVFDRWTKALEEIEIKDKEIDRLKNKYEKSGQECGRGHKNGLPLSLWDCPICTEKLRKEKEYLFIRSIRNDSHTWVIHIDTARERLLKEMQQALRSEHENISSSKSRFIW